MAKATYSAANKVLAVWYALRGNTIQGLSNKAICEATGESPANVTRALNTLIEFGLVERYDTGYFALSKKTLQIAYAHAEEVQRITNRMNDLNQAIAIRNF